MDPELRAVADRQAITDQCYRYCRALDRCDREVLESVFHPDSTHAMGGFEGSSMDFCGFAVDTLAMLVNTQHHLGNVLIELDGDSAHVESYFVAYHRIAAGTEGPGAFADHDTAIDEDVFMGGRYVDRFERRDGVWKIAHRSGLLDWCRWEAAADRGFFDAGAVPYGQRGKNDAVYTVK